MSEKVEKKVNEQVEVLITIKKLKNAEIETYVESKENIDISELLGVLEFAKMDFMIDHKNRQAAKRELDKLPKIKVKLEKFHFELLPNLIKEGFKEGDEYDMPEIVYNEIQQILQSKEQ